MSTNAKEKLIFVSKMKNGSHTRKGMALFCVYIAKVGIDIAKLEILLLQIVCQHCKSGETLCKKYTERRKKGKKR